MNEGTHTVCLNVKPAKPNDKELHCEDKFSVEEFHMSSKDNIQSRRKFLRKHQEEIPVIPLLYHEIE